jgi:hypothetical protein
MPAFEYDPKDRSRPFMHTNVAGDMTKQTAMDSMAEQGPMPGKNKLRNLAKNLAKKKKYVKY